MGEKSSIRFSVLDSIAIIRNNKLNFIRYTDNISELIMYVREWCFFFSIVRSKILLYYKCETFSYGMSRTQKPMYVWTEFKKKQYQFGFRELKQLLYECCVNAMDKQLVFCHLKFSETS